MSTITFYPELVPLIRFDTSTTGEPIGILEGRFWPNHLKGFLGKESVKTLQGGVRLDKFLTIVSAYTPFMDNLVTLMPSIHRQIYTWVYFTTIDLGHGDFEHGYSIARPFLRKVLPACYAGTIILQVKGTAVDRGGEAIHGTLKCWQVDDEDLPAGSITLHGRRISFTFKWNDIEENRVEIPQWHDLIGHMSEVARKGGRGAIARPILQ